MLPVNAACATRTPRTSAQLIQSVIPPASAMKLTGKPLPLPQAVLAVSALGVQGTPEFAVRIDSSLWTWSAPRRTAPRGRGGPVPDSGHQIGLGARCGITTASPRASVAFFVDWDPPGCTSRPTACVELLLTAHDVLTPDDKLVYSYRLGEGAWSDFGAARPIVLSAIEQQGGVSARVRDQAMASAWRGRRACPPWPAPSALNDGSAPAGSREARTWRRPVAARRHRDARARASQALSPLESPRRGRGLQG